MKVGLLRLADTMLNRVVVALMGLQFRVYQARLRCDPDFRAAQARWQQEHDARNKQMKEAIKLVAIADRARKAEYGEAEHGQA